MRVQANAKVGVVRRIHEEMTDLLATHKTGEEKGLRIRQRSRRTCRSGVAACCLAQVSAVFGGDRSGGGRV